MDPDYTTLELGTLWHISGSCRGQIVTPGSKYQFHNLNRPPKGLIGVQYTVKGMVEYRDKTGIRPVPPGSAFIMICGDDTGYGLPPDAKENFVTDWINIRGAGAPEHYSVLSRACGGVLPMNRG